MYPTPKEIKSHHCVLEHRGGYPIDDDTPYVLEKYDEKGNIIERIASDFPDPGLFYENNTEIYIEKYEYDQKGRLLSVSSNYHDEFISWYEYEEDEDGNEITIETHNIDDPSEVGYYADRIVSVKSPEGILLHKILMREADFGESFRAYSEEEYIYDNEGILQEVVEYGDHKYDDNGNCIDAKEIRRLKVYIDEDEDKTVRILKDATGAVVVMETWVSCKDALGNIFPKEYILEEEDICMSHEEYEYLDESFTHYFKYELNDFDTNVIKTEYWVKY